MVVGNVMGGKMADRFSPSSTVLILLLVMATALSIVYVASGNKILTLVMVFVTGSVSFSLVAPIQMLMIQTATGAEMIASAVIQASFNIGNALGAFLGGLPLVAGYSYASPNLVGVVMALVGAAVALWFIRYNKKIFKLQTV